MLLNIIIFELDILFVFGIILLIVKYFMILKINYNYLKRDLKFFILVSYKNKLLFKIVIY